VWTPDQTNIEKFKSKDKILSCAWSGDGLFLAYGTNTGQIAIRNRTLEVIADI
jgi:hypothetical protein